MTGNLALVSAATCVLLIIAVFVSAEECDKSTCKGPIKFYEELKCQPIYAKEGDCCAKAYNCSHLNTRPTDKCYANGNEYEVGEMTKREDSPCHICSCRKKDNNRAQFLCSINECGDNSGVGPSSKKGCYRKNMDNCCAEEFCLKNVEDVVTCEVDGKIHQLGEIFYPSNDSQIECQCMEGYEGKNVAPFCKNYTCGIELRHSSDLRKNCVPVYHFRDVFRNKCPIDYQCSTSNKTEIYPRNEKLRAEKFDLSSTVDENENMICKLGNIRMHIGDKLADPDYYDCVGCVCEVPPTPTCYSHSQTNGYDKSGRLIVTCNLTDYKSESRILYSCVGCRSRRNRGQHKSRDYDILSLRPRCVY